MKEIKQYDPENRFNEMFQAKHPVLSHYDNHISALSHEKLHNKTEIATELGWRDWQIEKLQAQIKELESENERLHRYHINHSEQTSNCNYCYLECQNQVLRNRKKVDEIKAQGIEEAIEKADNETYIGFVNGSPPQKYYRAEILIHAEFLRSKHD